MVHPHSSFAGRKKKKVGEKKTGQRCAARKKKGEKTCNPRKKKRVVEPGKKKGLISERRSVLVSKGVPKTKQGQGLRPGGGREHPALVKEKKEEAFYAKKRVWCPTEKKKTGTSRKPSSKKRNPLGKKKKRLSLQAKGGVIAGAGVVPGGKKNMKEGFLISTAKKDFIPRKGVRRWKKTPS